MKSDLIKLEVKKSYSEIAHGNFVVGCGSNDVSCCGSSDFSVVMNEDYTLIQGYQKEADLSLGCGLPTELADIKEGDTVVDLGSGAGNDAFIAASIVGFKGKVIGIDMTPAMIERAKNNAIKLGFENVDFVLNDIENMDAIDNNFTDVVISNCVMNLIPDKEKAYSEVYRIIKTGGHFSISDIVYSGIMPKKILQAAELYAGCISGASEKDEYLNIIRKAGFSEIVIRKERKIDLPDELLLKYLSQNELIDFKNSESGIYSVTINANK